MLRAITQALLPLSSCQRPSFQSTACILHHAEPSCQPCEPCLPVLEPADSQEAYDFALAELHRTPSLIALDKALEARAAVTPAEQLADLDLVKKLIKNQTQRLSRYTCKSCGFKARQFYWRCPACGGWETYPPRRSEEFDLLP